MRQLRSFGIVMSLIAAMTAACEPAPATTETAEHHGDRTQGDEPHVVSGLGVQMVLEARSLEGSSFRVGGVPPGYQVWAPITDGDTDEYLVFDTTNLHVATISVCYARRGNGVRVTPLERHQLSFEALSEFPVWEAQVTDGQESAPGVATEFTDGRFGYAVTTRGEERWLLEGWSFKSTEALRCSRPEMCPVYECVCGEGENGLFAVTGDRLACIEERCVAPQPCDEFCLSIDVDEEPT